MLAAENIDRDSNMLCYSRLKTGQAARLSISKRLGDILEQLPKAGSLFPAIAASKDNLRASQFYYLCKRLEIEGVTLHSYRYAWAERAKAVGYPERFAQEALGHNSKAVHRAYARRALVKIPSLEEFELRPAAGA
jgi:integrase